MRSPATPVPRPYVLLSAAMSLDGLLDDASTERLILSNDADLDRVDAVRASCDAIMVGAGTLRADNPRLLVRSRDRRAARLAAGLPEHPTKVTITSGVLEPAGSFFAADGAPKLVYTPAAAAADLTERLAGRATVVPLTALTAVLADLAGRGVRRLMVEGGTALRSQLLAAGLADELQLVVAPFFVGHDAAPRLVRAGRYPWSVGQPARLVATETMGGVVLLRYALSARCTG